jgi:hypothetical protein
MMNDRRIYYMVNQYSKRNKYGWMGGWADEGDQAIQKNNG